MLKLREEYNDKELIEHYNETVDERINLLFNSIIFKTNHVSQTDPMELAAQLGFVEIMSWIQENTEEKCTLKTLDIAAANGHLPVIEWLDVNTEYTNNPAKWYQAKENAIKHNHPHLVQWFNKKKHQQRYSTN